MRVDNNGTSNETAPFAIEISSSSSNNNDDNNNNANESLDITTKTIDLDNDEEFADQWIHSEPAEDNRLTRRQLRQRRRNQRKPQQCCNGYVTVPNIVLLIQSIHMGASVCLLILWVPILIDLYQQTPEMGDKSSLHDEIWYWWFLIASCLISIFVVLPLGIYGTQHVNPNFASATAVWYIVLGYVGILFRKYFVAVLFFACVIPHIIMIFEYQEGLYQMNNNTYIRSNTRNDNNNNETLRPNGSDNNNSTTTSNNTNYIDSGNNTTNDNSDNGNLNETIQDDVESGDVTTESSQ